MTQTPAAHAPLKRATYGELARLFLRMSVTAFGGPVAHIAMGEDEIVTRRGWITRAHYLDLVAAVNLIPGPNSTEVMIHVGYLMRGIPGAVLAGTCFIVPALLITIALTAVYVAGGSLAIMEAIFWGLKPMIIAVIALAGYRLVPSALKTRPLQLLFAVCLVGLVIFDLPEVVVMLGAGLVYGLYRRFGAGSPSIGAVGWVGIGHDLALRVQQAAVPALQTAPALLNTPSLFDLFWYFLRIGSILFGSGYVLFAYIQQDLVQTYGWLTAQQLLDAIAIGQFTPGPVFTSAGSVGYIVAGIPGAIVSALAIFLPSFVFVIVSAPFIAQMRRSVFFSGFLDGVNAGVLAAILLTVIDLARAALIPQTGSLESGLPFSIIGAIMAGIGFFAMFRYKVNATWVLLVGGIVGVLVSLT
ncbi:MAG: chromate efflux transporter [bacterium]|nr:chromate efflux transporter [bacterium]